MTGDPDIRGKNSYPFISVVLLNRSSLKWERTWDEVGATGRSRSPWVCVSGSRGESVDSSVSEVIVWE